MYRDSMTTPHIIRVVGMPRSGTAFASMVLNLHPDCIAYHELAAYDKNWKEILLENEADMVADCNTYGFLHEAEIPVSVLIYLDRNAEDSCKASIKATGHELTVQQFINLHRMMGQWALDNNAYVMSEGTIFTLDGMEILWKTAFGNHVEFPIEKAAELLKLNVQHHKPSIRFGKGVRFEV